MSLISPSWNLSGTAAHILHTQMAVTQLDFSLGLLRDLSAETHGSLVLSPLSVAITLAMVYAGARGETHRELGAVLTGGNENVMNETVVLDFFGAIVRRIDEFNGDKANDSTLRLNGGSRLYVKQNLRIANAYKRLMEERFMSMVEPVDFSNAIATSKIINDYLQTYKKFNNFFSGWILPEMMFTERKPTSKLALINSVYFSGEWLHQFNEYLTEKATFYISEGLEKKVDMMQNELNVPYLVTEQYQMIVLPYIERSANSAKKKDIAMVMVLPRKRYGLSAVLAALNGGALLESVRSTAYKKINVFMPKLNIQSSSYFVGLFQRKGVRTIFSDRADLSGMLDVKDAEPLFVNKIIQKAFMELDEKGTVAAAAAATGIDVPDDVIFEVLPVFRADHPFAFFVVDEWNADADAARQPIALFAGVAKCE